MAEYENQYSVDGGYFRVTWPSEMEADLEEIAYVEELLGLLIRGMRTRHEIAKRRTIEEGKKALLNAADPQPAA